MRCFVFSLKWYEPFKGHKCNNISHLNRKLINTFPGADKSQHLDNRTYYYSYWYAQYTPGYRYAYVPYFIKFIYLIVPCCICRSGSSIYLHTPDTHHSCNSNRHSCTSWKLCFVYTVLVSRIHQTIRKLQICVHLLNVKSHRRGRVDLYKLFWNYCLRLYWSMIRYVSPFCKMPSCLKIAPINRPEGSRPPIAHTVGPI